MFGQRRPGSNRKFTCRSIFSGEELDKKNIYLSFWGEEVNICGVDGRAWVKKALGKD